MALLIASIPIPFVRIEAVEKFWTSIVEPHSPSVHEARSQRTVWQPAPFQSPASGLGWNDTLIPHSSAMRSRRKRDIQSWSPESIPSHGPTWYSHCDLCHGASELAREMRSRPCILLRHDLGVDARNVDASVQAGAVVGLDQVTSIHFAGTCADGG